MSSIETLKSQLLNVIKDDNFSIPQLENVLSPVGSFFTNPSFYNNVLDVVNVITKDRNGDNQFNMDDLTLLGSDVGAITSLVGAIMLLLASIPSVKLQYNATATEELVFKVLAYIFIVIVPKQIGTPLSYDEKTTVVNIALTVYQFAKSSQFINDLIDKITAWFKSKGMCNCTTSADHADAVVTKNLPSFKLDLLHSMNSIREKSEMKREIGLLHQKLNEQTRTINKSIKKSDKNIKSHKKSHKKVKSHKKSKK